MAGLLTCWLDCFVRANYLNARMAGCLNRFLDRLMEDTLARCPAERLNNWLTGLLDDWLTERLACRVDGVEEGGTGSALAELSHALQPHVARIGPILPTAALFLPTAALSYQLPPYPC